VEALVAVLAPRSCLTIVASLGVLKANLAYLPLDVNAPSGRIETILTAVQGHKLILLGHDVDAWHLENSSADFETVRIAEVLDGPNQVMKAIRKEPTADSLAYVMFTSGSTGRPKGVMIEHRGIVRLARQPVITMHFRVGAGVAHVANIAFDASTWEIYTAILSGGTLVCIDFLTVLDARTLSTKFTENDVRVAKFTPALLEQCLVDVPDLFYSLDILISADDRFRSHIARQALDSSKGCIFNEYGPTENTRFNTFYRIRQEDTLRDTAAIGRAIRGSGAVVMDAEHRPRIVCAPIVMLMNRS
jgi:non-ribosomal peptide synthetase component F